MDNIKDIVKGVIGKISQKQPDTQVKLEQVWNEFIDGKTKECTHFMGVKDDIVYITVDSPARLHYLKSKKNTLLRNFKKTTPELKDVIYRVGQV